MKNLKMFCLSLEPEHYEFIKKLEYIPVGLGGGILIKIGLPINRDQVSRKKTNITENILFTIGYGKTI